MLGQKLLVNAAKFRVSYRILQRCSGLNWTQNGCETGNSVRHYKVTVVGASGGIGQPLSLLLKQNPLIDELVLHDIVATKGVAMDLSHICTATQVESFEGKEEQELIDSLQDSHVIAVSAGLPRKPGMDRSQLLDANASVAVSVACAMSIACPKALVAIITNPLNTLVPIAAEILKLKGCYDPKRLFGVTSLDVVRAKTFIGRHLNTNPTEVSIDVIGGHAGITILPVLSQCKPQLCADEKETKELIKHIQEAGTEVVNAKAGTGSATLSMAYAAAQFVNSLLRGLNDESGVVECAYVASDVTDLPYFSTPLELGPEGIKKNKGLPTLSDDEQESLEKLLPTLRKDIVDGLKYAENTIKGSGSKGGKKSECKQKS